MVLTRGLTLSPADFDTGAVLFGEYQQHTTTLLFIYNKFILIFLLLLLPLIVVCWFVWCRCDYKMCVL